MQVFAILAWTCPLLSAAFCGTGVGSCTSLPENDETSLVQLKQTIKPQSKSREPRQIDGNIELAASAPAEAREEQYPFMPGMMAGPQMPGMMPRLIPRSMPGSPASAPPSIPRSMPGAPASASQMVPNQSPREATSKATASQEDASRLMAEVARSAAAQEHAALEAADKASELKLASMRAAAAQKSAAQDELNAANVAEMAAKRIVAEHKANAQAAAREAARQEKAAMKADADEKRAVQKAAEARKTAGTAKVEDFHASKTKEETIKANCANFVCGEGFSLKENPEELSCDGDSGCTPDACCDVDEEDETNEDTTLDDAEDIASDSRCAVGDAVQAVWKGDGRMHLATITHLIAPSNAQGKMQVSVSWMDGDPVMLDVDPSTVLKYGKLCWPDLDPEPTEENRLQELLDPQAEQ